MFTLIMSIVSSILSFYLTSNYFYFSLIALGIYFLIRKNVRAETFAGLNLVLISAVSLLGKFRPYSLEGLNFVIIGSFFVILYDILKEWYSLIPMFALTGIGISLIASVKYGKMGMLIGLVLIPVLIREYTIQKKIEK